jgi:hypothetical protein
MTLKDHAKSKERAMHRCPQCKRIWFYETSPESPLSAFSAGNEAACSEKLCKSCWNELPPKEKAEDLKALTRDFSQAISKTRPQMSPTISHGDAMLLIKLWFAEMAAANLEHGGSDTWEDLRRYAEPLLEQDPEWREFLNFHCREDMRLRGIK